jgi:hypothetical protein
MTPQDKEYLQEVEDRKEFGLTLLTVLLLTAFFIGIIALIGIVA